MHSKLQQQFAFLIEIDKVKSIIRKSRVYHGTALENDAEHSWHICVMAMVLEEYSNVKIDLFKVIKMLLIHDLVEIYSGDTFLYAENRDKVFENEKKSAEKIFGMLPEAQAMEFMDIWIEFEERKSAEAKYASVLDRIQPLLSNCLHQGYTWKEHKVSKEMVLSKNKHIAEGSDALWEYAKELIEKASSEGCFVS